MSGLRVSPPPEQTPAPGTMTEYSYRQPCAIPSYLIAIASGELVYRPFDGLSGKEWKTGCWAEVSEPVWTLSNIDPIARHDRSGLLGIQKGHCQVGQPPLERTLY